MVADQFLSNVQKWSLGRTVNLNDYSDKFHYLLMPLFLIMFATMSTVKQYVFQPIICETPTKPSGIHFAEYVSNLCWVEGTYSGVDPLKDKLTVDRAFWDKQPKDMYYQWIPFTLALQAALFYLPRLFWHSYIHNREGPDLEALLENAAEANKAIDWKQRQSLIDGISRNIDYMLTLRQNATNFTHITRRRRWRHCCMLRPRGCLPAMYGVAKLLFLANALGQLYLMGYLLEPEFSTPLLFGFYMIGILSTGSEISSASSQTKKKKLFPRVSLCRVEFPHSGSNNAYLAQCALPLNMFNEKIYCFLWVAAALGVCFTCLSLVQWALRIICGRGRWRHHLKRYLLIGPGCTARKLPERQLVLDFAKHLHTEGVFLVHMLRLNVGEGIACDVTNMLYELWRGRRRHVDAEEDEGDEDSEAVGDGGHAEAMEMQFYGPVAAELEHKIRKMEATTAIRSPPDKRNYF